MNVVDSSAWLEYLVNTDRASLFVEPIERTRDLIVPVLVIYELFKKCCESAGNNPPSRFMGFYRKAMSLMSMRDWQLTRHACRFP